MGHPAQDASTAAQAAQGLQRGVCDKAGVAISTLPPGLLHTSSRRATKTELR